MTSRRTAAKETSYYGAPEKYPLHLYGVGGGVGREIENSRGVEAINLYDF